MKNFFVSTLGLIPLLVAGSAGAALEFGTYPLANHPASGGHGLRLDELQDVTASNDSFVFDFDHPSSNVQLTYAPYDATRSTVRIFGNVYGGRSDGAGGLDANTVAVWLLDFTYSNIRPVTGDPDDLRYLGAATESVWGTISGNPASGPVSQSLSYLSGSGTPSPVFRLGNEDDDLGHLGFDGISGWGWLEHGPAGSGVWEDGDLSEWSFVVVPEPGTFVAAAFVALGAAGYLRRSFVRATVGAVHLNR